MLFTSLVLLTVSLTAGLGSAKLGEVPSPQPLWEYKTEKAESVYARPIIDDAGDVLTSTGSLRVISGRDGSLLSEFKAPDGGEISSTPLLLNGAVIMVSNKGIVYSLTRTAPSPLWDIKWTANMTTRGVRACGSPTSSPDGRLIFVTGATILFALDSATGAEVWFRSIGAALFHTAPVALQNVVISMSKGSVVQAFDQRNGNLVWHSTAVNKTYDLTPCGSDSVVVAGSSIAMLNTATGAVRWVNSGMATLTATCDLPTGLLVAPSQSVMLYGLDIATGNQRWINSLAQSGYIGAAAIANGFVYGGAESGNVRAMDATTGSRLWTFRPCCFADKPLLWSGVTFSNNVVYFKTNNGPLFALPAAATGHLSVTHCADVACNTSCNTVEEPVGSCRSLTGLTKSVSWADSTAGSASLTVFSESISCSTGSPSSRTAFVKGKCYGSETGGSFKIAE